MKSFRRIIASLAVMSMLCALMPLGILSVSAATEGDYTYTVSDGKATITKVNTEIVGAVTVPDTLGGYPVTAIGSNAFKGCAFIESILIPPGVTEIGAFAFRDCQMMFSADLPTTLVSLGNYAFMNCTTLGYLAVPERITTIEEGICFGCSLLDGVLVTGEVSLIKPYAFYNCVALKYVELRCPDSLLEIQNDAFSGCTYLDEFPLPGKLQTIGEQAFLGCLAMPSLEVPATLTSIGDRAFLGCISLSSITVEEGNPVYEARNDCLIRMADRTLILGCDGSPIPVDGSVETIGSYAFAFHLQQRIKDIPAPVKTIEDYAFATTLPEFETLFGFAQTSGLQEAYIDSSVTSIGRDAFLGCDDLTIYGYPDSYAQTYAQTYDIPFKIMYWRVEIETLPDKIEYEIGDDLDITGLTLRKTWFYPEPKTEIITDGFEVSGFSSMIGGDRLLVVSYTSVAGDELWEKTLIFTVTVINNWSVSMNKGGIVITGYSGTASEVTVPGKIANLTVNGIGNGAFSGRTDITSITLPDSIETIGDDAFAGCEGLKTIVLPEAVTAIGDRAFSNCSSLQTVTLPDGLKTVGAEAFAGCISLTGIAFGSALSAVGDMALLDCSSLAYITKAAGNSGITASGNCLIRVADQTLLAGCRTSIVPVNGSVRQIADYAFYHQDALESLTVTDSVTAVGDNTFIGCDKLTLIGYEGTYIESYAARMGIPFRVISRPETVASVAVYSLPYRTQYLIGEELDLTGLVLQVTYTNGVALRVSEDYTVSALDSTTGGIKTVTVTYGGKSTSFKVTVTNYWTYTEGESGVTVTGYTGADTVLTVPARLASKPVTAIGEGAFSGNTAITGIQFPESVTVIDKKAFYGCTALTELDLPDGLKIIDNFAFWNCTGLRSVDLPDTVEKLGDYAFGFCTGLSRLTAGAGLTAIGKNVFYGCRKLTIYGYNDTAVRDYAADNGLRFIVREEQTDPTWRLGDMNADGEINSDDLTQMARFVARIDSPNEQQAVSGDLNADGKVDSDDLTKMAQYIARIIDEL